MLLHLKNENFKEEIQKGTVLVDFYADWCGPCKMLGPVIEELSRENPGISIIKVNVDEHEDLAREYAVMSIPTLLLIQDGQIVKKQVGFVPKEVLSSWIQ